MLLVGCGNNGITQEEYNKVVAERNELQGKLDRLQKFHNEMMQDYVEL